MSAEELGENMIELQKKDFHLAHSAWVRSGNSQRKARRLLTFNGWMLDDHFENLNICICCERSNYEQEKIRINSSGE